MMEGRNSTLCTCSEAPHFHFFMSPAPCSVTTFWGSVQNPSPEAGAAGCSVWLGFPGPCQGKGCSGRVSAVSEAREETGEGAILYFLSPPPTITCAGALLCGSASSPCAGCVLAPGSHWLVAVGKAGQGSGGGCWWPPCISDGR